jgi:hypothetical protein
LRLGEVRFETFSYRNINNKDKMFLRICKAKIIVFREAAFIANACASTRIAPWLAVALNHAKRGASIT